MITKKDSITSGVIDYFRNALAAVGRHSRLGNEKYPPVDGSKGLRWSFDVSTEHADAIASHLSQRGEIDPETGYSHTVALAWRALALLETELVDAGAKPGHAVVRNCPDCQEPDCLAFANLRAGIPVDFEDFISADDPDADEAIIHQSRRIANGD